MPNYTAANDELAGQSNHHGLVLPAMAGHPSPVTAHCSGTQPVLYMNLDLGFASLAAQLPKHVPFAGTGARTEHSVV